MTRDILFWAVTSCCCAFTLTAEAKEVPPIPKGYANEQAVMTAIVLGQVKLIDAKSIYSGFCSPTVVPLLLDKHT